MLEEGEFSRSGLMCDWCCRHCEVTPPPRCPSCGIMYKTQHEAEICCTEEGWKDK
jgi:rubrerythrin